MLNNWIQVKRIQKNFCSAKTNQKYIVEKTEADYDIPNAIYTLYYVFFAGLQSSKASEDGTCGDSYLDKRRGEEEREI